MRRKLRGLGFTDTPQRLVYAGDNATKRVRAAWLEQAALAFVDFCIWRRRQDPVAKLRPPSRRKFLSAAELAELDKEREREGDSRW
jgi:hypothetical protein